MNITYPNVLPHVGENHDDDGGSTTFLLCLYHDHGPSSSVSSGHLSLCTQDNIPFSLSKLQQESQLALPPSHHKHVEGTAPELWYTIAIALVEEGDIPCGHTLHKCMVYSTRRCTSCLGNVTCEGFG